VRAARLRQVLQEHYQLVWRALRRFGVPEANVDDALQHVFLIFHDKLSEVPAGKERAFLLATSVRVAANARRLELRRPDFPSEFVEACAARAENPENLLEWKQRRQLLDCALDTLPPEQRSVFVLFELEGMSVPDIAESLHIPVGTVASRLRRARGRFEIWINELKLRLDGGEA
jgi:RNA polymerase sigma-70 factor (ECF subfamily)